MNRSCAVAVLTAGVVAGSAQGIRADVRAEQRGLVKFAGVLGGVVNMFGGKAAREGVKTTDAVKGDRKLSLTDNGGQIVDLKEEKLYELDIKKKTYKVTTFEEIRRRIAEAQRKAEEDARKQQPKETTTAAPAKDKDAKEVEVDFSVTDTGQKKVINGFDTHQVLMVITLREKGKTLEQSGGLVLTADTWLGPTIAAMSELAEFDLRYARQLAGPMVAGASPEEMAAAMSMYPGLKDAMARMRSENVKLNGTPILATMTVDAVKSAEDFAAEQKQSQEQTASSATSGNVSGIVGGLMRRAATPKAEAKPRATFMTTTTEVLKVSTDVTSADVAIPAGFKEAR